MQEAVIALLVQAVGDWVIEAIKSGSYSQSSPHPGSVWITAVDGRFRSWNGKVVSAYYHPTRPHTATTVGKLGTKQSQADPGQWAISITHFKLFNGFQKVISLSQQMFIFDIRL